MKFRPSAAAKVALFYCAAATAWIVASDQIALFVVGGDVDVLHEVQTFKGIVFVVLMAVALYGVVARLHRAELQNRQMEAMLRVSQRLETLGALAGTLVHDLNNMLGVIRGFTDLARLDQQRAGVVSPSRLVDIEGAVVRANAMVRQMSLFLQREPGAFAPADPAGLVRDFEPLLRQAATPRVRVLLEIEPELPGVRVDRGAIEQALLNLVVNARDAMEEPRPEGVPPRPRELRIRVTRVRLHRHVSVYQPQPVSGTFVCISVSDTGCGIPPENAIRVFDPFFTTKPEGRGTGLGLASVLRTAQQHGGWVEVESKPGEGARFDLYLPVTGAEPGGSR